MCAIHLGPRNGTAMNISPVSASSIFHKRDDRNEVKIFRSNRRFSCFLTFQAEKRTNKKSNAPQKAGDFYDLRRVNKFLSS
jgi:hypothetical protein